MAPKNTKSVGTQKIKPTVKTVKRASPMQATEHTHTAANGTKVDKHARPVVMLATSEIMIPSAWNVRTGDFTKASGGPSAIGCEFPELVTSLETSGQDTAVTVRPNPNPKGPKFLLVTGFRRMAAIAHIAAKGGDIPNIPGWDPKKPTIRAEIRELDEVEARALNLRENTARDDLKPADLAFGVYELAQVAGSVNLVAQRLGKNQSYVNSLYNIVKKAPECAKKWRDMPTDALTIAQMKSVSEQDTPAAQKDMFAKYLAAKAEKADTAGKGLAWLKKAKNDAAKVGAILGTLHRQEYIAPGKSNGFRFTEALVRSVVRFKEADDEGNGGPTKLQTDAVVDAARTSYKEAFEYEPTEESDDESDE